jgi:hypothetical protein
MVICGELTVAFSGLKIGQLFEIYFGDFCFGNCVGTRRGEKLFPRAE